MTLRDITSGIHAVMPRRGKTAHVDVRAFVDDLFHRRLVAGNYYRPSAPLYALMTGNSGPTNIYPKSARQAEPAGHQESHQRQRGALAVDDDVMTNQNG